MSLSSRRLEIHERNLSLLSAIEVTYRVTCRSSLLIGSTRLRFVATATRTSHHLNRHVPILQPLSLAQCSYWHKGMSQFPSRHTEKVKSLMPISGIVAPCSAKLSLFAPAGQGGASMRLHRWSVGHKTDI